jgi:hypothetical protein
VREPRMASQTPEGINTAAKPIANPEGEITRNIR